MVKTVSASEGIHVNVAIAEAGAREALYTDKRAAYFDGARADMLARLPDDPAAAVIEIGCGSGATGAMALRDGKAGRYVGVELSNAAASVAARRLSEVVVGDVEAMRLPWQPGSFDALILSEVLEHLIEPWSVVSRAVQLVRPGGRVLASSPNVAHWRVVREIMMGRFELADEGVFDRTHMRWFTPTTFRRLFEQAGVEIVDVGPVTPFAARTRMLSRLTGGRLDHLFMSQILLEGRRIG
ncbi:MAG: hypothetical protein RLZ98_1375 [Pseudomonadota bacterium]|jgi:SAM-dependent methyltransferase